MRSRDFKFMLKLLDHEKIADINNLAVKVDRLVSQKEAIDAEIKELRDKKKSIQLELARELSQITSEDEHKN